MTAAGIGAVPLSLAPHKNFIKTRDAFKNLRPCTKYIGFHSNMNSSRDNTIITVLDISEIEQMSWEEFGSRKHSEMFENHFSIFDNRNFSREGRRYQWGQLLTHLIMLFMCLACLIWYCNSQIPK